MFDFLTGWCWWQWPAEPHPAGHLHCRLQALQHRDHKELRGAGVEVRARASFGHCSQVVQLTTPSMACRQADRLLPGPLRDSGHSDHMDCVGATACTCCCCCCTRMQGGPQEGSAAGRRLSSPHGLPVQRQPDEARELPGRHQQRAQHGCEARGLHSCCISACSICACMLPLLCCSSGLLL